MVFINIKDKIIELYKKNKKLFFISIMSLILAIVILVFPIKNNANTETKQSYIEINNASTYNDIIEKKIESLLENLSSIKSAKVMVMTNSSAEHKYLVQKETTKTNNDSKENIIEKEEVVYEKNGSNQTPVLVSTVYPKITGVLIVLNKVDNSTKVSLQNAIAGVLNIDASCIFILQDR